MKTRDNNYIPDILETIANLSNDEVFTPPKLANDILDLLPKEIWKDSTVTFLDPAVKTGIFLREIARRLIEGLADEIPDLQKRVNHILTKQVFGLAITELTSLMARRTVYCAMEANSPHSVCTEFTDAIGNIKFPDTQHSWDGNGRCEYCGANESKYNRGDNRENYAYPFIHNFNIKETFGDMKFDVIIGNPPYQLNTGGNGAQSNPLYDKFVERAISMNSKYISMIIPSRWFTGGMGLDNFRKNMLNDKRIKIMNDFINPYDCFQNVSITGGVCYFLWDRDYNGKCKIRVHYDNEVEESERFLLENDLDIFIRREKTLQIYKKAKSDKNLSSIVSSIAPFGWQIDKFESNENKDGFLKLYKRGGYSYIEKRKINKNMDKIDKYKVFISKAYFVKATWPQQVINKPIIGEKNSCCTETYLCVGEFGKYEEAFNLKTYLETKFLRFMVSIRKGSQNTTSSTYKFVPLQDFSKPWTDEELYKKYKLTQEEIDYIEEAIEPMTDDTTVSEDIPEEDLDYLDESELEEEE